jgi:hypothetical protein
MRPGAGSARRRGAAAVMVDIESQAALPMG